MGVETNGETWTITDNSLDALSSAMSRNTNFLQDDINQVRTQAQQIPAVVYADLQRQGYADGIALIKEVFTNFYLNPNENTYRAILGIYARYNIIAGVVSNVAQLARTALTICNRSLNNEMGDKFSRDIYAFYSVELARYPADPRFEVFTYRGR